MTKLLIFSSIVIILGSCNDNKDAKTETSTNSVGVVGDSITYAKNDLTKIKWIEGKWRGMYNNKPFYEIYQFVDDNTLQITSYEWDRKDSTKSSKSFVSWKDGAYYLGDEMNYKVTEITSQQIKMLPNNKASNDILWKYVDNNRWDAILKGKSSTNEYHMERFDPFR